MNEIISRRPSLSPHLRIWHAELAVERFVLPPHPNFQHHEGEYLRWSSKRASYYYYGQDSQQLDIVRKLSGKDQANCKPKPRGTGSFSGKQTGESAKEPRHPKKICLDMSPLKHHLWWVRPKTFIPPDFTI